MKLTKEQKRKFEEFKTRLNKKEKEQLKLVIKGMNNRDSQPNIKLYEYVKDLQIKHNLSIVQIVGMLELVKDIIIRGP